MQAAFLDSDCPERVMNYLLTHRKERRQGRRNSRQCTVTSDGITKALHTTLHQAHEVQSNSNSFPSSFGSLFFRVASKKKKNNEKGRRLTTATRSSGLFSSVPAAKPCSSPATPRRDFGAPLRKRPCVVGESTVPVRAVYARHTSKALLLKEKRRHLKGTAVAGPPPASSKAPLSSLRAGVKPFN